MIYPQSIVYALEAIGYLATLDPDEVAKTKDIANRLHIPEHFLGKVLTKLVKRKFVKSIKGPSGGFKLNSNTRSISVYRILASLDGLSALEDNCVMGLKECSSEHPCVLHDLWKEFKEKAIGKTQSVTIAGLSDILMAKHVLKS